MSMALASQRSLAGRKKRRGNMLRASASASARLAGAGRPPARRVGFDQRLVDRETPVVLPGRSLPAGGALIEECEVARLLVHDVRRDHVALLATRPGAEAIDLSLQVRVDSDQRLAQRL